jgi:hypothetical protein
MSILKFFVGKPSLPCTTPMPMYDSCPAINSDFGFLTFTCSYKMNHMTDPEAHTRTVRVLHFKKTHYAPVEFWRPFW